MDTSFIAKHEAELLGAEPVARSVLALAAVAFMRIAAARAKVPWAHRGWVRGGGHGKPTRARGSPTLLSLHARATHRAQLAILL